MSVTSIQNLEHQLEGLSMNDRAYVYRGIDGVVVAKVVDYIREEDFRGLANYLSHYRVTGTHANHKFSVEFSNKISVDVHRQMVLEAAAFKNSALNYSVTNILSQMTVFNWPTLR